MHIRAAVRWTLTAVAFEALVKLALADLDSGPWGYLLPILTVLAGVLVFVTLHETGHLIAALLLRLEVVGIRISYNRQSFVRVKPDLSARALPLRFVLWHLAGPAVDFALAVALVSYATRPVPEAARDCLLVAALTAFVLGAGSLLPHTYASGVRSDGAQVLRWAFRPSQAMAALKSRPVAATDAAALRRVVDESIDDAGLDAFIASTADGRAVAVAVYLRFRRSIGLARHQRAITVADVTIGPSAAADYARLHAYVVDPGAPPAVTDALGTPLGVIPGLWQLHRVTVSGHAPDPAVVAQIATLAEALTRRRPEAVASLVVAAVADLLRDRPAAARQALQGVSPSADDDKTLALLIRAVAEAALGDHAQADRLVNAVRRVHTEAGRPAEGELPPVLADILAALRAGAPSRSDAGTH